MDKTLEEIRAEMIAKKDELLPEMNNPSVVAIWYLLCDLVAGVIKTFQDIFNHEKRQLEIERERQRYGKLDWLSREAKKFQYGDSLDWNKKTGQSSYSIIDESKQIIAIATASENNNGGLVMKVAKLDAGGLLVALDANEQIAFKGYMEDIKVSGTDIGVLSQNADVVSAVGKVYFDGNYMEATIRKGIMEVLETYRLSLGTEGIILFNDVVRIIRSVPGVDDVLFDDLTVTPFGQPLVKIERDYLLAAGYFNYADDMMDFIGFEPRYTV